MLILFIYFFLFFSRWRSSVVRSVGGLALQDLYVPEEEEELGDDQGRGSDHEVAVLVVHDQVPDEEDGGNQEENRTNHRVDLLHSPDGNVEHVDHIEHNVDDQDDKVQPRDAADVAVVEARATRAPGGAEERRDDDPDDDLDQLDESTVSGQVVGVQTAHLYLFALLVCFG